MLYIIIKLYYLKKPHIYILVYGCSGLSFRFFSQEMVMPSPLIESSKKLKPLQTSTESSMHVDSLIKEKIIVTKEGLLCTYINIILVC